MSIPLTDPLMAQKRKGDEGKVKLALELRNNTTMPLEWIAGRLQMGTRGYLTWLLQRQKTQRQGNMSIPLTDPLIDCVDVLASAALNGTISASFAFSATFVGNLFAGRTSFSGGSDGMFFGTGTSTLKGFVGGAILGGAFAAVEGRILQFCSDIPSAAGIKMGTEAGNAWFAEYEDQLGTAILQGATSGMAAGAIGEALCDLICP